MIYFIIERMCSTVLDIDLTQVIVSAVSAGGLGSIISLLLTRKKYKIETMQLEQQLKESREDSTRKSIDFIQEKMKEIANKYEAESETLRKRNEELDKKISDLNSRLQNLMEWVVVDNNRYRNWLETELRKLDSSITFPECPPAPIATTTEDNH